MATTEFKFIKASPLGDNAFPKISGKVYDFMAGLRHLADSVGLPPVLDIEGTVKLHGMHADLVFDLHQLPVSPPSPQVAEDVSAINAVLGLSESTIPSSSTTSHPLNVTFQSRNRICDPDSNQHGWPREIAQYPDALVYIRDRVLTRYTTKDSTTSLNTAYPLIIAGEWIGPKVQKDVGVSKLSARFVIISIQINGIWQNDLDYSDIEATKAGIYSVFRSGQQIVKMDTSDLSENNPTLLRMQKIADAVEECCPFSAAFGVNNSRGEGVVWKPGTSEGRGDALYWLKTKGPIFGPENRIDADAIATEDAKKKNIDDVCRRFVSARRVEQGFEYLLELGIPPSRVSVRIFMDWIVKDIWLEEKTEIAEMEKARKGAEGLLKKRVKWFARCAFIEAMNDCDASIAWLA